jgi:hypothetical protein
MKLRARTRIAIAVVVVLILGFFVPPLINVNRYRGRIVSSMESALGRPVTVGSVSLRLFPQPGFDLGDVSIGEDPAFGYEPMLHADEVEASLRLSSLWRGRLEVAKLSLTYPSLNLVRAEDGRWNIESLLQHAAQIPTAPTGKTRPEARPRFPYIEANGGRINFKIGAEKKVYALSDADFSLWLASEDEVRTRLKARMVRTDSYLSDTGEVTLNGRFQRASDLRDTPMEVQAHLVKAQLGQLTKFADGQDRGWRGAVDADLTIAGRPTALKLTARAVVNDFRRYDISTTEYVRLDARCTAALDGPAQHFSDIACRMPMGDGTVSVNGTVDGFSQLRGYDLKVAVDKVPVQRIVSLVRHAKKDIPDDLSATGAVNGALEFHSGDGTIGPVWSGRATTTDIVLRSGVLSPDLSLKPVQFSLQTPQPQITKRKAKPVQKPSEQDLEPKLVIAATPLDIGGSAPAKLSGWIARNGYDFTLQGDSQIKRILQVAQVAGIRAPQVNAEGAAKLDLAISGAWHGLSSPKPVGTAQLHGVTVRMKGIAEPMQIASTTLNLGPDNVTASNVDAQFRQAKFTFTGWVKLPRQCETIQSCPIEFNLHSDQLVTDDLNRLLNPRAAKRPWYAILESPEPSFLGKIQATGQLSAGKLVIKSIMANHVTAQASLSAGQLLLSNVHGELWNGKHVGQWRANFAGDEPIYEGNGTLDAAAMAQLASAMHDNWATGKITGAYKITMSGNTSAQLLTDAKGDISFDWQNGTLRHVTLANSSAPLAFHDFSGALQFSNGTITLAPESKMTTHGGIYQVSGTASPAHEMNIILRNGSHAFAVTGTLGKPKVTPAPASQAQVSLKQ